MIIFLRGWLGIETTKFKLVKKKLIRLILLSTYGLLPGWTKYMYDWQIFVTEFGYFLRVICIYIYISCLVQIVQFCLV